MLLRNLSHRSARALMKMVGAAVAVLCFTNLGNAIAADDKEHNQHEQHAAPSKAMAKLQKLSGKEFESEFLKHIINHHEMAISMGELVHERGSNKDFTGWRTRWWRTRRRKKRR
jgi:hypothetical protein